MARAVHAHRARLVLALPRRKEKQVKIVSRRQWGARKPKDRTYQDPRSVREVFLHYSESPSASTFEAQRKAMQGLQDFHMDGRGWSDIAYNYLVFNGRRPRAFYGRGARVVPAAQANHNTNTIAVCVVMRADDKLTWQTKLQLRRLIWHLRRKVIKRNAPVKPHSAVTQTSCPGDQLRAFIKKHY
jgi:hypothetical protein